MAGCGTPASRGSASLLRLALVIGVGLALPAPVASARRVEVLGLAGYQFGGGLDTKSGHLDLGNGAAGGLTASIQVRPDGFVEVFYTHQGAGLELEQSQAPDSTLFDVGVHVVQVGGTIQRDYGRLSPFVGMTLGVAIFDPEPEAFSTETRFAGSLSGGTKVRLSPRVGLRGQFSLWAALFSSGSSIFCSLPGTCAISVSGDALVQGATSAGVFIVF